LIELRKAALEARENAGLRDCLRGFVALELAMFVPALRLEGESAGDLDNFVSGVCDGLQKADSNVKDVHILFKEPGLEGIEPGTALLFDDDKQVVSICAKKWVAGEGQQSYYKVVVEEIEESAVAVG
jgi:Holliday junction resolvase RusA-like endonuclease